MSAPNAPPELTASGSPATIIEFLYYAVNSILFYRGVYESEDFRAVNKYEQDLVLVRDGEVTQFLDRFFKQVEEWLGQELIRRVILAIVSKNTGKTLERWVFNLEPHDGPAHLDKIQHKIQATLKQLKATIPIFPDIKEPTIFNLLAVKRMKTNLLSYQPARNGSMPIHIQYQPKFVTRRPCVVSIPGMPK
ncbi:mitotic spindle checkpoint component mad2 [Rhizoctonia solani]|uniref:Mitotic spindle checkpoint component mad2 n=1 Tax=Rhizoctonia solani TaxID=456999 RepID=A0A8H8P6X4_9AGAM|nr:mitotic spindle checkpoint component mad2 [Rhizoctonia solani]QRW24662.1 mitotic spindle checkpoint component mad2 [Rhizoctonia solani]